MNEETIKIIEPSLDDMTFIIGESKILKYKVRNTSDFKIKDLSFSVETLLKEPEGGVKKTLKQYASITEEPKILYPGKDSIVKVSVKIPVQYNEYITKKDGDTAKQPFRIKLHAKGIEYIEEL